MSNSVLARVDAVLSNPVIRTGLKVAAPEVALAVDALRALTGGLFSKRQHAASEVIGVMDQRLAVYIQELAKKETSKSRKKELEVRIHELLGVLDAWDKVS
jgi:L-cysteine desulfidase